MGVDMSFEVVFGKKQSSAVTLEANVIVQSPRQKQQQVKHRVGIFGNSFSTDVTINHLVVSPGRFRVFSGSSLITLFYVLNYLSHDDGKDHHSLSPRKRALDYVELENSGVIYDWETCRNGNH